MTLLKKYDVSIVAGVLGFLVAIVLPIILAHILVPERGVESALTPAGLAARLESRGLDLDWIIQNQLTVPRVYVARFPSDWVSIDPSVRRKDMFLAVMLLLVLRENEQIFENRVRLTGLLERNKWLPSENFWFFEQAQKCSVNAGDRNELLDRMDEVPPALALAQAAIESGWGSSGFARERNTAFSQWTRESGQGMVSHARAPGVDHKVRKLTTCWHFICASPAHFDRMGTPRVPDDLKYHNCLIYSYQADGPNWQFQGPDGNYQVPVSGNMRVDNGEVVHKSLLAGLGIGYLPAFMISEDVKSEALVTALNDYIRPDTAVYVVYSHSRYLSAKVRAFVDFMVECLANNPSHL